MDQWICHNLELWDIITISKSSLMSIVHKTSLHPSSSIFFRFREIGISLRSGANFRNSHPKLSSSSSIFFRFREIGISLRSGANFRNSHPELSSAAFQPPPRRDRLLAVKDVHATLPSWHLQARVHLFHRLPLPSRRQEIEFDLSHKTSFSGKFEFGCFSNLFQLINQKRSTD